MSLTMAGDDEAAWIDVMMAPMELQQYLIDLEKSPCL